MDDSIRVSDADRDRVTAQLRDHFAAGERVSLGPQRLVGGYGQVKALAQAVRVEAEQPPLGVEDRAAGRAGQQRRGVLEAAGDAAAARAPERPVHTGDKPERHA